MWQAAAPVEPVGCTKGDPAGTECTFVEAHAYCDQLFLAAFDDWRVPAIDELRSLVRGCSATVTDGACPVTANCVEWAWLEGSSLYT